MFDGLEANEALEHDDRSWLSVVAVPAAQACEDPSGECKGTFRVRIFLTYGFAFEVFRDRFESGPIVGVKGVFEGAFSDAVALAHELQHSHGGNEAGGDQLFERPVFGLAQSFDVEALGLERPEQLFQRWR